MKIHLQRLLVLQRVSVGLYYPRQRSRYVYWWPDYLLVYGTAVERLASTKGRTAHEPSNIFSRFQKRPPWLNIETYSRNANVVFKMVNYVWVFWGQPSSGYHSECSLWSVLEICKWSGSCNTIINMWGFREMFYAKKDPHTRKVQELLVYNIPCEYGRDYSVETGGKFGVRICEHKKYRQRKVGLLIAKITQSRWPMNNIWLRKTRGKLLSSCHLLHQKPHTILARDRSETFVVSGWRLKVWCMARPRNLSNNLCEIGVNGKT